MKKLYFLLFSILISGASFGQDLVITGAFDGPLSGGLPKAIEIYVINDVADLSTYGIGSASNGGGTDGVEFVFSGSATAGDFLYISTTDAEFNAYFGFSPDFIEPTASNNNGDDAIELFYDSTSSFSGAETVVDTFGEIDVDGTGAPWEYLDGWAYRNDGTGPDGSTFTLANWSFSGPNAVDGCTTNASCGSVFPIGTYSTTPPACTVTFNTETYSCTSNTIGNNNDGVIINVSYNNSDAGITSVTTTAVGGSIGGDNPAVIADGTITILGLMEGDAWDLTLNGGDCDGTTISGTVGADICDPAPNTCFDLSGGAELFESVTVVPNTDMDEWTESSGTYSMNGFVGGGEEDIETWLVFGPLDMTSVSDLVLSFDASEQFGTTDLVITYTSTYSGCPSTTTWVTPQTITASGNYDLDVSGATGTQAYIGIQYVDDGADGYSSWSLSNVALNAYGSCPTLGTRTPSNCPLSVDDNKISDFSIYPNPTNKGFVNISSRVSSKMNVSVYDILGKQVIKKSVLNDRLDVSSLKAGVYIMKITQGKAVSTKKLVIE